MPLLCESSGGSAAWFRTTHWSLVWRARNGDSQAAASAREDLCRSYWRPIYAYLRRDRHSASDAQDLTHEFLSRLIHREWLDHLEHEHGKFRNFMLTFLKHFVSDQRDHARALKRGGGAITICLDELEAEERDNIAASPELTPEQAFERRWARAVMERAIARLEREYAEQGRAAVYEELRKLSPGEHSEEGYAAIGARLGLSEGGVKSAVHRMRKRHSELLREEIGRTVGSEDEIDEEIRFLMRTLAG
jgi:RNA polymerase sigma factor (sigma-70 family)